MIKEICQFVETLEKETPDLFEEGGKLKEGVYMALDIRLNDGKFYLHNVDENGSILKQDIIIYAKGKEDNPSFKQLKTMMLYTPMVSVNKSFNSSYKFFISTCNPFIIGFSKKNYINKIKEKNYEAKMTNGIKSYFKAAKDYVNDDQVFIFNGFENIVNQCFFEIISRDIDLTKLKTNSEVIIFCKGIPNEFFQTSYSSYLKKKLFNKEIFNVTLGNDVYGIADNLNTFTESKLFLKHQTATFDLNYRITTNDLLRISKFYWLLGSNLPNPLPIFVDKEEANLNSDIVTLFNEKGKASYSEIISSLYEGRKTNLQNFYLLFIQNGKIIDIDFVPLFHYQINQEIYNLMEIKDKSDYRLKNIFDLENELNKIFSKNHRDTGIGYGFLNGNYFTDKVEGQKTFKQYEIKREILTMFYKYRISIYDYIYKSKLNAISKLMFDEMVLSSIIADISSDKFKENKHSKDSSIKEKLNLWFSLYNFFELNKNLKQINMKQNLKQHREMMQELIEGSRDVNTDDEFAFVAGQTIYYIFSKSVSADKSYSKLEPFLQKTDCSSFKQAIVRTFDMYKHENFTKKFSKSMAQVMGYQTDRNLKELTPFMLAGFFANNLLFSDKDQTD